MVPGKYIFKGTVSSGERKWNLEQEFEIKEEQAKEINGESVFKIHVPQWLLVLALLLMETSTVETVYLKLKKD